MKVEICVDDIESAITAASNGADRLELCSALPLGGLTPSLGFVKTVDEYLKKAYTSTPPRQTTYRVMLRSRDGDFRYTNAEKAIMSADANIFLDAELDPELFEGFVVGAAKDTGDLDFDSVLTNSLAEVNVGNTLHRVSDLIFFPTMRHFHDLEGLWESLSHFLKIDTVLTSGGRATCVEGGFAISDFMQRCELCVMPGCGLNADNLSELVTRMDRTPAWVHSSCSVAERDSTCPEQLSRAFGTRRRTSGELVKRFCDLAHSL
eukprot:Blabericola_migrator_1__5606@NODE_2852_length_2285_cov_229_954013_g1788_i0_p1_GENE_NODE_2852_length_2285_cov_229_954013_g1788_i0NODE_2852_length_2285_cov_229_954013_g1788_i0_p1_ORF_typecomplete_len263_score51_90CutC/PF03932_14/1_4e42_NODE_2852_length_2285_cov_229_954013_g1788_i02841072